MSDSWHYVDGGAPVGPVSLPELRQKLAGLSNAKDVLVWCDRLEDWKPAKDVPELTAQKVSAPPPLPHKRATQRGAVASRWHVPKLGRGVTGVVIFILFLVWLGHLAGGPEISEQEADFSSMPALHVAQTDQTIAAAAYSNSPTLPNAETASVATVEKARAAYAAGTNDMARPSFDCATAKTAAARLICADAELARLDRELASAFQKRKTQISASDKSTFTSGQLTWIRDRNARCELNGKNDAPIEALAGSKQCMVSAFRERIAFLAQTESVTWPSATVPVGAPRGASAVAAPPDLRLSPDVANALRELVKQVVPVPAPVDASAAAAQAKDIDITDDAAALKQAQDAMGSDNATAYRLGLALASKGNPGGEALVGAMLSQNWGIPTDYKTAMVFLRRAADQGDMPGALNLAGMYEDGKGVAKNYAAAVAWYLRVVTGSDPQAGYLARAALGRIYGEGGYGITQDYVQAYKWFDIVAAHTSSARFARYLAQHPGVGLTGCLLIDSDTSDTDIPSWRAGLICQAALQRDEIAAKMTQDQIAAAKRLARSEAP
jgi:uncharacterized protein YecT (DUF1311 family)